MPGAGRIRERVEFHLETEGEPDGGGGAPVSWETVLTVWGQFVPERGRERLEAGRLEAALAGVLTIRSSIAARAIGAEHRVLIGGVPFQIRSISNPDQRNRFLEFVVEKGVAT